ncbi:MAG: transposase [Candidatus Woesearchaeota archaeon]
MARPLRIEYPGALYHIISRGNGYQDIYKDDQDRLNFFDRIKDAVEIHNLIIHAYCLMGNHYHLLIETPDANLSKAMRDINGNYAQWFNVKHQTVGHLFQDRYKSYVIEKEAYLLEVARYIVLNSVRANLVGHPRDWNWSSYNSTAGNNKTCDWLHSDWILGFFGKEKKTAQKQYRQFVKDGIDADDPHDNVKNGFLLGSPQFVHWIWEEHTNGFEKLKEHPREQRIVGRPTLQELFEDIKLKEERNAIIRLARIRCGYLTTEIADIVGLDPSTVGKICKVDKHKNSEIRT